LQYSKKWLTSKESKLLLKISDCKPMHLRLEGKIKVKKREVLFYIELNKTTTQPSSASKISSCQLVVLC
jgi:hypothetical protein